MRFPPVARGVISLTAVTLLVTSCALLIPENPSQPRYNTVLGQRHMPAENAASMRGMPSDSSPMNAPAPQMQQAPAMEPQSSVQPMSQTTIADLPPVDPQTQYIAQQRMMEAQQSKERSLWDRMAFWRDDDEEVGAMTPRSVPVENQAAAMNSKEDYPMLSQVPPAPPTTGADSDAARLAKVRAEMERERSAAAQARSQLTSDAAADMPASLPPTAGVVAAPLPVTSAPVPPPPAPMASAAPMIAPPPPMPVYAAPAPVYSAPTPAYQPAPMEPIVLRAPAAAAPVPTPKPAPSYARAPTSQPAPVRSMPPAAGAFDPMAGETVASSNTPYYGSSSGYLPPSRYTYRR